MNREKILTVNGEEKRYVGAAFPATVQDLIAAMGLEPELVVAEVNGVIVRRGDIAGSTLVDGDRVELVKFVGGG